MVVFMKDLEAKLNKPEFIDELRNKAINKYDPDLADAAKIVLKLLKKEHDSSTTESTFTDEGSINYVLRIKKAITLLSAELFRKIHHKQSRDIISGINENFHNEFNKFYSPDIPIRFLQTLGDIAYSHGIDFYATLDLLPPKSNGYCSDYMHPRFIACLLRLGDLLDVDDKRFNQFTNKVFSNEPVQTSAVHERKHASITHLLVTPENIEITVDCKEDEAVFRIANQWFDWLKIEVDQQNKEWHSIRPKNFPGLAPTISRNKVQVLFNGIKIDSELINLKFNISKEKVFEIFEGSALYDDPSFVFIREITQNSVDATKIQIWKDIEKGIYDSILRKHFKEFYNYNSNEWDNAEIIKHIKFPNDIPNDVFINYIINFNIDWLDESKETLLITLSDKGCGISKSTLLRMSNNVGDSRKGDSEYQNIDKSLPYFLKPTGAFGLGLQSIFIISDEFEIMTKNDNDNGWHIIFRSARYDQYISSKKINTIKTTGTKLTIKIPKTRFSTILIVQLFMMILSTISISFLISSRISIYIE